MKQRHDSQWTRHVLRINFEAAINHRGWSIADLIDMTDQRTKEEKRYE